MEEMANMISASRSYQSSLEVINTAKDFQHLMLTQFENQDPFKPVGERRVLGQIA